MLCPGEPFFDGVCNAELLDWAAYFQYESLPVESATWGAIKSLYR